MILTNLSTGLTREELSSKERNTVNLSNKTWQLIIHILKGQITSLFFLLIFFAGVISYLLNQPKDAFILFTINIINVVLGFIQEYKAGKAAEKLQSLVSISVRVIRDRIMLTIDSSEIVMDDIIKLVGGDSVPVDMYVRFADNAYIDNSVRTGETKPQLLSIGDTLLSGAQIISGEITAQVTAVGNRTSIALYSKTLSGVKKETSFEKFVAELNKWVLIITGISIAITGFLAVFVTRVQTIPEFILFAISLIIGVVPESLPLVITLILTNAALILSKQKVIVKRLSALQELGSIQFLLTDKTGTLTENTVKVSLAKDFDNLPFAMTQTGYNTYERSPMDNVFDTAIKNYLKNGHSPLHRITNFIPFSTDVGYSVFSYKDIDIIRGQYKAVSKQCKTISSHATMAYQNMEHAGLRVITFATKQKMAEYYTLSGLLAFEDPLKMGSAEIIKSAEDKEIDIKILTGDSVAVAEYVARKLHVITKHNEIISLEDTPVKHLSKSKLLDTQVFAKCTPDDKLKLIERYSQYGSLAFLGEGINDALALKKAHVGMVVHNSSDVARQSADILLTEKSLSPIIRAVLMGRKSFIIITNYLVCTLSGNAGTLFSLIIILFVWGTIPLLPIHILLNNLLTDIPLFLLVYDTVSKELLHKKPDITPAHLFKKLLIFAAVSTVFDLIFFVSFFGISPELLRSEWFVFGVWSELIFILSIRSDKIIWKSPKIGTPLIAAIIITSIVTLCFTQIPFLAQTLLLESLSTQAMLAIFGLTMARLVVTEIVKVIMFRKY
jgi:P-type Mg2+ transporter